VRQTAEHKRWSLVLTDPQSPPELRAEAQKHLGLSADSSLPGTYRASLDAVVQGFWHRRKNELEQRDPIAERVYHSLVSLLVLGGNPATVVSDTETVLAAFAVCRTSWMRRKTARALLSAVILHRDSIPTDLRERVEAALDSITDVDVQRPEERDWLQLTRKTSNHN